LTVQQKLVVANTVCINRAHYSPELCGMVVTNS